METRKLSTGKRYLWQVSVNTPMEYRGNIREKWLSRRSEGIADWYFESIFRSQNAFQQNWPGGGSASACFSERKPSTSYGASCKL